MAEERKIEKDFRALKNFIAQNREAIVLADLMEYWIPIVTGKDAKMTAIAEEIAGYEKQAVETKSRVDTAKTSADKAEKDQKNRLDKLQKEYDALENDLKGQVAPAQKALASLQSQVLLAKKELDANNQAIADKQKEKDSLFKSMEKEKQTFEADMTALRQKHFGT